VKWESPGWGRWLGSTLLMACLAAASYLALAPFNSPPSKEHRPAWYLVELNRCPADDGDAWGSAQDSGAAARRACLGTARWRTWSSAGFVVLGLSSFVAVRRWSGRTDATRR
jgi:hypothetical protein